MKLVFNCVLGMTGLSVLHSVVVESGEVSGQLCERRGSKLLRQERIGSDAKHAGHFELHDLTKGKGVFYVSHEPLNLQCLTILEDVCMYVHNIF